MEITREISKMPRAQKINKINNFNPYKYGKY